MSYKPATIGEAFDDLIDRLKNLKAECGRPAMIGIEPLIALGMRGRFVLEIEPDPLGVKLRLTTGIKNPHGPGGHRFEVARMIPVANLGNEPAILEDLQIMAEAMKAGLEDQAKAAAVGPLPSSN